MANEQDGLEMQGDHVEGYLPDGTYVRYYDHALSWEQMFEVEHWVADRHHVPLKHKAPRGGHWCPTCSPKAAAKGVRHG